MAESWLRKIFELKIKSKNPSEQVRAELLG